MSPRARPGAFPYLANGKQFEVIDFDILLREKCRNTIGHDSPIVNANYGIVKINLWMGLAISVISDIQDLYIFFVVQMIKKAGALW